MPYKAIAGVSLTIVVTVALVLSVGDPGRHDARTEALPLAASVAPGSGHDAFSCLDPAACQDEVESPTRVVSASSLSSPAHATDPVDGEADGSHCSDALLELRTGDLNNDLSLGSASVDDVAELVELYLNNLDPADGQLQDDGSVLYPIQLPEELGVATLRSQYLDDRSRREFHLLVQSPSLLFQDMPREYRNGSEMEVRVGLDSSAGPILCSAFTTTRLLPSEAFLADYERKGWVPAGGALVVTPESSEATEFRMSVFERNGQPCTRQEIQEGVPTNDRLNQSESLAKVAVALDKLH